MIYEAIIYIIISIIFTACFYAYEISKIDKVIVLRNRINHIRKKILIMEDGITIAQLLNQQSQQLADRDVKIESKLDAIITHQHKQDLSMVEMKGEVKSMKIDIDALKKDVSNILKSKGASDGLTISLKGKVLQKGVIWGGSLTGVGAGVYQIIEHLAK